MRSLKNPHAQFLLQHNVWANWTHGDNLAMRFKLQNVSRFELELVANGLRKKDATRFIEGEFILHIEF